MVTLTIDPKLFPGPSQAHQFVSDHRCLGLFIKDLKRGGVAMSDNWFAAVEFHKSGWPHWHVLVESAWIDHLAAKEAWDRQAPRGTQGWFGRIRISKHFGEDIRHAVNYTCKYILKAPREALPAWALERVVLRRYTHSRGLFPPEPERISRAGVERDHLQPIGKRLISCGDPDKRAWEILDGRGILVDRRVMNPDAWIAAELQRDLPPDRTENRGSRVV
jgi:hypothetical protein